MTTKKLAWRCARIGCRRHRAPDEDICRIHLRQTKRWRDAQARKPRRKREQAA